ncbi:hypothetical protein HYV70_05675 [Candidatus Uhrbacteria bacterium]|nr:hypothetical protein [Candidatus Uhrbacteria bacterium]
MCFSATASFTASAVLVATGAASLTQVKKKQDYFLASIPFLFGIQQFLEGLIWIFPDRGLLTLILGYGFLFFAFLLWPAYVPLATWAHEPNLKRRRILRSVAVLGAFGMFYLLVTLLTQPLVVDIIGRHVCYLVDVSYELPGVILYVAVTTSSFFFSSKKFLQLFGLLILFSAGISWIFYERAFTSVWCFFAAGLSVLLFFYLRFLKKRMSFLK